MHLPSPKLSIDKLAVVAEVPESRRGYFVELVTDPGFAAASVGVECMPMRGMAGYGRGAILRRDGEAIRVDCDPYRKIVRRTAVSEETWRGRDYDLRHTLGPEVDRETGEVIERGVPDPFQEFYADDERLPFLRIEGNPNKFPGFDDLLVRWGRAMIAPDKPAGNVYRPTRLDVACDYPVSIEHFGITASRKRADWQHREGAADYRRQSGKLETMYLGASGTNRYRIYDKAEEIAAEWRKSKGRDGFTEEEIARCLNLSSDWDGHPITRCEAELRNLNGVGLGTEGKPGKIRTVRQLVGLMDPFSNLEVGSMCVVKDDEVDPWDFMFACAVQVVGLDAALKKLPPRTRSRWRERLGIKVSRKGLKPGQVTYEATDATVILHPSIVFRASYAEALKAAFPSLLH